MLLAIAELKTYQIIQWKKAHLDDASIILDNLFFAFRISQWLNNESAIDFKEAITTWMASRYKRYDYKAIALIDPSGKVRLSVPGRFAPLDSFNKSLVNDTLLSKKIIISDLHCNAATGELYIDIAVPILITEDFDQQAISVMLLRIDPEAVLFPKIQTWPLLSTTGETLLLRKDGHEIVVLNELRHRKNTALTFKLSNDQFLLPASLETLIQQASSEGTDYRGNFVLAAIKPIPESSWIVVSKLDEAEIYAPVTRQVLLTTTAVLLLTMLTGVGTLLFMRQRDLSLYRKQHELEHAQQRLSQRYEYLLKNAHDMILFFDQNFTIIEANHQATVAYGYTLEELLRMQVVDLRAPEMRSQFKSDIKNVTEHHGFMFETVHQRKDGTVFPVEISSCMVPLGEDETCYLSIIRNISDRKQAELELIATRDFLENVFNTTSDGIMISDKKGYVSRVNTGIEQMLGFYREELVGKHTSELSPQDEHHMNIGMNMLTELHEKGSIKNFEAVWLKKDGNYCPIELNVTRLKDAEGNNLGAVSVVRDITLRKQAEQELVATKDFLENIFNTTTDMIMVSDSRGYVLRVNKAIEKILGFRQDEIIGKHTAELAPLDEHHMQVGADIVTELREKGFIKNFEAAFIKKDGSPCPIELNVTVLRDSTGTSLGSVSVIRDITERKQSEKDVKDTRDFLENIFNTTTDGIIVSDANGYITKVNNAITAMLGFEEDEIIAKHTIELVPHDEVILERTRAMMLQLFEQEYLKNFEVHFQRKDGSLCPVELNIIRLKDSTGACAGDITSVRDITERKNTEEEKARLQQQLWLSQKLEAVGHLAGGIAHDFNNILTAVIGYGSLLEMKMKEDDPLKFNVKQILASADRAANLVRSMLAYSRKQIINPKPVSLNEIIHGVEPLLMRTIGEDIELRAVLFTEDTAIYADTGQIEQILMNLVNNARDALPSGGHITITTQCAAIDEPFISCHGFGKIGSYVMLTVTDSGIGMDTETQKKIFEPFFTTKDVGKGTGLGLSTVYGIVKQHNGFINCYSETGQGTTFKIYLPALEPPAGTLHAQPAIQDMPLPSGGTETILVAEDDQFVRELMKDILGKSGYAVIEATDGEEAIRTFKEHRDEIQLTLLDVIMPKRNGREIYDEIQNEQHDAKILFTSGYTADIIHQKGLLNQNMPFVMKPVSPTDLLRKVREVLDA